MWVMRGRRSGLFTDHMVADWVSLLVSGQVALSVALRAAMATLLKGGGGGTVREDSSCPPPSPRKARIIVVVLRVQ